MKGPRPLFVVRRCRFRDIAAISDMLKASWHAAHDHILGKHRATQVGRRLYSKFNLALWTAQSILSSRTWKMLVATRDDKALGYALAQLDDGSEVVLYTLYVHPQCTGQGVGSALLQAVLEAYSGAKAIRLEVLKENMAAIAWYKAKGFAAYGETKSATATPGVASLYMDKTLDTAGSRR